MRVAACYSDLRFMATAVAYTAWSGKLLPGNANESTSTEFTRVRNRNSRQIWVSNPVADSSFPQLIIILLSTLTESLWQTLTSVNQAVIQGLEKSFLAMCLGLMPVPPFRIAFEPKPFTNTIKHLS